MMFTMNFDIAKKMQGLYRYVNRRKNELPARQIPMWEMVSRTAKLHDDIHYGHDRIHELEEEIMNIRQNIERMNDEMHSYEGVLSSAYSKSEIDNFLESMERKRKAEEQEEAQEVAGG